MRGISLRVAVCLAGSLLIGIAAHGQCTVNCSVAVPTSGVTGSPVSFQGAGSPCNCSGTATYAWTFGDGGTSTEPSPSHTYSTGGAYSWQLTVTADSTTCTKSGTIAINASGIKAVAGTYTGTLSNGQQFQMTVNSSSQITQYKVYYSGFCGGTGNSTVNTTCSISNGAFSCGSTFCAPFAFTTSLSGTFASNTSVSGALSMSWQPNQFSSCCSSSPTFTASLSPAPLSASASGDPTSGIVPLNVNFTAGASGGTPPYTYNWDFGDCATSTSQNPSHSYTAGVWAAALVVSDSVAGSATAIVPINATPAGASMFIVSAPPMAGVGSPFSVTVTAKDSFGNTVTTYAGEVAFSSNDSSPTLPPNYTFQPGDAGVHTFTDGVTLSSPGSRSVTVTDTSNASINGSATVAVGYPTTTSVTSTPNPTAQSATATLTATVTSSQPGTITGSVTFKDGGVTLGSAALSGTTATFDFSSSNGGPHTITAEYPGDGTYLPSTSPGNTHYVLLSAPIITATATAGNSVSITWPPITGADHYTVWRSTNNAAFIIMGNPVGAGYTDPTVSPNTAYFYRVAAVDAGGNPGAMSATDTATTIIFTDDPVVAGSTIISAVHLTQLREAVNALRAAASMGNATFTDPSLAAGSIIRTVHIQELRDALAPARSTLGLPALTFTDPTLTQELTPVKAVHVEELRGGMK